MMISSKGLSGEELASLFCGAAVGVGVSGIDCGEAAG